MKLPWLTPVLEADGPVVSVHLDTTRTDPHAAGELEADAEALAHVHVTAWRETYRGLLSDAYLDAMSELEHARRFLRSLIRPEPSDLILLAADRRGAVGYAQAGPARSRAAGEGEIYTLYLLREAQGRGLGRRLLASAARALAVQGATSLVIAVLHDNLSARSFYEHLGGVAGEPYAAHAPGGGLTREITYRWAQIADLARG